MCILSSPISKPTINWYPQALTTGKVVGADSFSLVLFIVIREWAVVRQVDMKGECEDQGITLYPMSTIYHLSAVLNYL